MLDRIAIHIEAPAPSIADLRNERLGEPSAPLHDRVQAARLRQQQRFSGTTVTANARMTNAHIRKHCVIDSTLGNLLQRAMAQLCLSTRAYDRILRVTRTIADLASSDRIEAPHLLEAIQYRRLDRNLFY